MNDTTKPSEYLEYWGEKYKNDLLTDILPFWLKYGIDHENGGYFTCLGRDGSLLDTNKSVWFQGRFAFILAYAYNNLEKRAEWLEACKNGIDFIEKYCFDTDGRMGYGYESDDMYFPKRLPQSPWLSIRSLRVTRAMLKKRSSCSNRFSITKTHRAH